MYKLDIYHRVRRAVRIDGMSERVAAIAFGIDRGTVSKMLEFSEPPGYRLKAQRPRSWMDEHAAFVDQILSDDQDKPKKQRHTVQRIFERLRDEKGFEGGYTTVRDYVRPRRQHLKEAFVPLTYPPGHSQADFGEAIAVLGGVEQKVRFFVMSLPQSDAVFVKAYHAETAEAFCDGHVGAFGFFGGVPLSILYDNTKLAVAQILGDGDLKDALIPMEAARAAPKLAMPLDPHEWFNDRKARFKEGLERLSRAAKSGAIPGGSIENGILKVDRLTPAVPPEAAPLILDLNRRLPVIRITDLLQEIDGDLGFTVAFAHLRTSAPCNDKLGLLNVLLAEGLNIGLSKMAEATSTHDYFQLSRLSRWHIESEAINRALATVIEAQSTLPLAQSGGAVSRPLATDSSFPRPGRAKP